MTSDREISGVHGNDERLGLAGLRQFLVFLYTAVLEVAAAN